MNLKSKKKKGVTLIEVIISMALIGILSVGVYNSYLLIIRNIKEGEVKQSAAIYGKKTLESIKSFDSFSEDSGKIKFKIDDTNIIELTRDNDTYKDENIRLDKNFNICNQEDDGVYIQSISIKPNNNNDDEQKNMDNDKNLSNILSYKVYFSNKSGISINKTEISLDSIKDSTLKLFLYIQTNSEGNKEIKIKDINGNLILTNIINKSINKNINHEVHIRLNFKDYVILDETIPINIIIYNNQKEDCKTNIYIEKSIDLSVNTECKKGIVYIYNNRNENNSNNKIGILYDVKTEIKNKDGETLFTGYSNQNININ